MTALDELFETIERHGAERYGMEAVSQAEHALQCAARAEDAGAPPALITAALFHDIGHLIDNRFEEAVARGLDRRHEEIGAAFLARWFGPAVTEPVRLHVEAKRYLCGAEPEYVDALSPASVRTLALQGGPLDEAARGGFLERPHAREAVAVRRWDEAAKDPAACTPPLAHFRLYADASLAEVPRRR